MAAMIDINGYYKMGFSKTLVMRDYYNRIINEISKTEWIKDPSRVYKRVPSWLNGVRISPDILNPEIEKFIVEKSIENCPKPIYDALSELVSDPRVIGEWSKHYTLKIDFVDVWDGVENILGWHWDGSCQSDVVSIMYLNDTGIGLEYGGGIEMGERDIPFGEDWIRNRENILSHATLPPAGRVQVWLNNMNPRFVHRPLPLTNSNSPRITLAFGCKLIPCSLYHDI
jgi:hypothetical protein